MQRGEVLTFHGTRSGFNEAFRTLRQTLDQHDLPARARYHCELVFDEVATNIIRHAYADEREHQISVALEFHSDAVVMTFEDDGIEFDPSKRPPARPPETIDDAETGGRGLLLVRMAAHRLQYERTIQQHNRLRVTIAATV